ncbi:MAG: hypothetical protein J0H69_17045 [Burkholderiales bacterium]|nr:hypothetical protein [Burkholderiales bacterium]
MNLQQAQAAGQAGMQLSLLAALDRSPDFAEVAKTAILRHLRDNGATAGEDLVEVARAHGAHAKDDRAFGGIFHSLSRKNLIRCLRSDLPRKRGHGTSGGKLWALVV